MILAKTGLPPEHRQALRFTGAANRPSGLSPWAKLPRPGLHWRPAEGARGSAAAIGFLGPRARRDFDIDALAFSR